MSTCGIEHRMADRRLDGEQRLGSPAAGRPRLRPRGLLATLPRQSRLRLERDANGGLIVMPPASARTRVTGTRT